MSHCSKDPIWGSGRTDHCSRSPEYADMLPAGAPVPVSVVRPQDLFLLIFTSGSTGCPRRSGARRALCHTGGHVATVTQLTAGDVVYSPAPFFHSSSLFTGWSSSLTAGVPIAIRTRFSASGTLTDIRRHQRHRLDLHGQGAQLHPGGT